jgi:hypothetical protein
MDTVYERAAGRTARQSHPVAPYDARLSLRRAVRAESNYMLSGRRHGVNPLSRSCRRRWGPLRVGLQAKDAPLSWVLAQTKRVVDSGALVPDYTELTCLNLSAMGQADLQRKEEEGRLVSL